MGIDMLKLFSLILLTVAILSSCVGNEETSLVSKSETVLQDTEELQEQVLTDVSDMEQVKITSLDELTPYMDNGTLSKQHYDFYYDLLSGESMIPAYNTLQISDYTIQFSVPLTDKTTKFDFTVTESEMDTLPLGTYSWQVRDGIVLNRKPESPVKQVLELPAVQRVYGFLNATGIWNTPTYGEEEICSGIHNYICLLYGEDYKVSQDTFSRVAEEEFGITDAGVIREMTEIWILEDGFIHIGGVARSGWFGYVVSVEETEDTDVVVIQYYGDYNYLLKSHRVAYTFSKDGKWLGYTILELGKYQPKGLHWDWEGENKTPPAA